MLLITLYYSPTIYLAPSLFLPLRQGLLYRIQATTPILLMEKKII